MAGIPSSRCSLIKPVTVLSTKPGVPTSRLIQKLPQGLR